MLDSNWKWICLFLYMKKEKQLQIKETAMKETWLCCCKLQFNFFVGKLQRQKEDRWCFETAFEKLQIICVLKFTATGSNNLSDQFEVDTLPATIYWKENWVVYATFPWQLALVIVTKWRATNKNGVFSYRSLCRFIFHGIFPGLTRRRAVLSFAKTVGF